MKSYIIIIFSSLFGASLLGQVKYTISGYVMEEGSQEKLADVTIFDQLSKNGTYTNEHGFFSLSLDQDSINLFVSSIGYQDYYFEINLKRDTSITVYLKFSTELETIEVKESREVPLVNQTQSGKISIALDQVKSAPALLGEVDILKVVQLLPGVQAGLEGLNGFHVRGGSNDQNLILLDGIPIYNSSHLLGLFSTFNADVVKYMSLYKSGFPARYGGRISSILDVRLKDGNMENYHGKISLALLSSKLHLEGPIKKEKSSFLVSIRRSYYDIFANTYLKIVEDEVQKINFNFYDINAKYQQMINDKNRIFGSIYVGNDIFGFAIQQPDSEIFTAIKWNNKIASIRWNKEISAKFFSNISANFSDYNFENNISSTSLDTTETSTFATNYQSRIQELSAKMHFDFVPNPNHYIKFGANLTRYSFKPGTISIINDKTSSKIDTTLGASQEISPELSLYIEDELSVGKLKAHIGLHYSAFFTGKTYSLLQPRVSLNYKLMDRISAKLSLSRMQQYVSLLSNETISLPSDIWIPSTQKLDPLNSWQYTLGLATSFKGIDFSIDVFYKKMNNVNSYKDGSSLFIDIQIPWEDKITQGEGESYGIEFFMQKKIGNSTGWFGYTLSRNWRRFDEINKGIKYPYKYDRRNSIQAVWSHQFSKKFSTSATWVYGTGNAVTLPNYIIEVSNGRDIFIADSRNNYRMSPYHRLDIGCEFKKQKKRSVRIWSLSVYNAYFRINPYFIEIVNWNNGYRIRETGILPIIPNASLSYEF